eukprot:753057-Hanusia_phi.AAC.2
MQHVLEHGRGQDREAILQKCEGQIVTMSQVSVDDFLVHVANVLRLLSTSLLPMLWKSFCRSFPDACRDCADMKLVLSSRMPRPERWIETTCALYCLGDLAF